MKNLKEIGEPDPVPLWPPAPGWYALGGLVTLLLLWVAWRAFRGWRAAAYRREALKELQQIEKSLASEKVALQCLPELLKRTALTAYPRTRVASLAGDAWLGFLDGTLGSSDFTKGPGRILPELAYRSEEYVETLPNCDVQGLLKVSRRWIRRHGRMPTQTLNTEP